MLKSCAVLVLCGIVFGCQGATGPAGKDGNANVQVVSFTLTASSWTQGTGTSRSVFTYSRSISQITADIANNGAVLVYQSSDGNIWRALPFSQVYNQTANWSIECGVFVTTGALGLTLRDTDPNNPLLPTNIAASRFRCVVIAPSPIAMAKLSNVDIRNYDAVVAAFDGINVE